MRPYNVIHYATPQIEFTQNIDELILDSYISTTELKADLKVPSPSLLFVPHSSMENRHRYDSLYELIQPKWEIHLWRIGCSTWYACYIFERGSNYFLNFPDISKNNL